MTKQQNNASLRIITIIAMMFLYAMISFVTNLAAPVGKIWGESFADPAQAQRMGMLGNLFNFLAYLIMGIPAGNFLAKFGYKKTALTAIALGFIGIGVQWFSGVQSSFAIYLTGADSYGFCRPKERPFTSWGDVTLAASYGNVNFIVWKSIGL